MATLGHDSTLDFESDKIDDVGEKKSILNFLYERLACDKMEASTIYYNQPTLQYFDQLSKTQKNIELLTENGVTSQTIIQHPFLLTMKNGRFGIDAKLHLTTSPTSIIHFLPF